MPPAAKPSEAAAIGSAIAAVLAPLPNVDKAKVQLANARTGKARAEWNKICRQLRRNIKSKGVQCVKVHDSSNAGLTVDQIRRPLRAALDRPRL